MKRRARLRRGTTRLKRATGINRKQNSPRRSSRVADVAFLQWVRTQPCAAEELSMWWGCAGRTEPDHQREGVGGGRKASDRDSYPLCSLHHRHRHDLTGPFRGWTRERLRTWIAERIAEANARYEIANRRKT